MINQETLISIESLKKNIPFNDDSLQYLALFGSRINNTARSDSSLNMFYICEKDPMSIYDTITNAAIVPGGVKTAIAVPHSIAKFERIVNVYGTAEYYTMRNIHPKEVLYQAKSFEYAIKEPDFVESAKEYLFQAKDEIPLARKLGYEFACGFMYIVIDYSLRAYLIYNGIKFPFTRNLKILHDFVPDKNELGLNDVDFNQVNNWRKNKNIIPNKKEGDYSIMLAEKIYNRVKELTNYKP